MASNSVNRLNKVLQTLNNKNISDVAYKTFKDKTPIRSGNARNKTKLRGNTIDANYPYAQRLEEGYSKQAKNGMTEPTINNIRNYVYATLGIKI